MSKPLVREACRDIDHLDQILTAKSGLRNVSGLLAILAVNVIVMFMGYDDIVVSLIRCYSIILLLDSLRSYVRIVFKAHEVFGWVSFSEICQSIAYLVLVLVSITFKWGVTGIVAASILSTAFSFSIDLVNSKKYSKFKLIGGFDVDRQFLLSAAIFTLTNIMWVIITKIDIIMLSILSSNEDVGIYGVANRVIFFGLMGISVVSNVLFPPLIKKIKTKGTLELTNRHLKVILTAFVIIVFGVFITTELSDLIVISIAGVKYLKSAEILNILLLFLIIQALSTPIKLTLYAVDKEKLLLLIVLPLPILKIIFNKIGFELYGLQGIAYSTVFVYFIYLITMLLFSKASLTKLLGKS